MQPVKIIPTLLSGLMLISTTVAWGADKASKKDAASTAEVKPIMHKLFESLKVVYTLSLSDEEFSKPQNKDKINKAFDELEKESHKLSQHIKQDLVFSYMGQSLERDLKQAQHWYAQKGYREASFTVRYLVENCYACHTKLKSNASFHSNLVGAVDEKKLNIYERARLKISTRQFDEAQSILEELILNPVYSVEDLELNGVFVAYLKLMLRVKRDIDSPLKVLETLVQKKRLGINADLVQQWISDLKEIKANGLLEKKESVELANSQIEKADAIMGYPSNQRGLVRYVTASAILHDLIAAKDTDLKKRAQSYHLLGKTENLLENGFWINEAQYYWEAAIRTLPHSEVATKAFNALLEKVVLGFSGSSGVHVPFEVQMWLDELHALATVTSQSSKVKS